MPFIETLGQQALSGAVGGLIGSVFGGAQDRRQYRQQKKLQALQIKGQKEMGEFNYDQQMKMWNNTNYGAQIEHLKAAGLNPGLIYGMGGGGGATATSTPGNVSSSGAPTGGGEPLTGMGMMMGAPILHAQMRLMESQAKNLDADTKGKLGETPEAKGRIADLAAGVIQKEAQTKLTNIQTEIQQIEKNYIATQRTLEQEDLANRIKKGAEEIESLRRDNKLSEEQYQDKIQMYRLQMAEISIKNSLNKALKENINQDTKNKIQEIKESEARIKNMAGILANMLDQTDINWNANDLNWYKLEREQKYIQDRVIEEIGQEGWDAIKDLIPGIILPLGKGTIGPSPIKGFHKR